MVVAIILLLLFSLVVVSVTGLFCCETLICQGKEYSVEEPSAARTLAIKTLKASRNIDYYPMALEEIETAKESGIYVSVRYPIPHLLVAKRSIDPFEKSSERNDDGTQLILLKECEIVFGEDISKVLVHSLFQCETYYLSSREKDKWRNYISSMKYEL